MFRVFAIVRHVLIFHVFVCHLCTQAFTVVVLIVVNMVGCLVVTGSPLAWILMKISGHCSYKPPRPFKTLQGLQKPQEIENLETKMFEIRRNHVPTTLNR